MRPFIRHSVSFVAVLFVAFVLSQTSYCSAAEAGAQSASEESPLPVEAAPAPQLKWTPPPFMTVGGLGVLGLANAASSGSFIGGYVFFGLSLLMPVKGVFSLIPVFNFEVAPGLGNWGFVSILLADFNVMPWASLDIGPILVHDWDPLLQQQRGQGHTGYAGVTVGPTILWPNGMSISISATLLANVEGFGWVFNPTLTISVPLPPPN